MPIFLNFRIRTNKIDTIDKQDKVPFATISVELRSNEMVLKYKKFDINQLPILS